MSFVWPTSHVGMLHPLRPVGSKARKQGENFLRMAELAVTGIGYAKAKQKFEISHQQAETRKSLYEELGLLYVPAGTDQLVLTDVGRQLYDLLGPKPPATASSQLLLKVDTLLCWAMSRCQLNRPQSLGSPPITQIERSNCSIRPYATFWRAMLDLEGQLSFEEFRCVLSRVQRVEEYDNAVGVIRAARVGGKLPKADQQSGNFRIYWNSHLTLAGSVLSLGAGDTFTFTDGRDQVITEILRAQAGCEDSESLGAIRARPWSTVQEYYNSAGQACPPYLADGTFRVVDFGSEHIVVLRGYPLQKGKGGYFIEGDSALCTLRLLTPCFHGDVPDRMLRVDSKHVITPDQVRVTFGLGRPIGNSAPLLTVWNEQ